MQRRDFVMSGCWLAASEALPFAFFTPLIRASGIGADHTGHVFAVFDSSLPVSVEFARRMRAADVPLFDAADDIGALWHATLAARLRIDDPHAPDAPVTLFGVTRASDGFVLQRLAGAPGFALRHSRNRGGDDASDERLHTSTAIAFTLARAACTTRTAQNL
jgi:hypothetical protein